MPTSSHARRFAATYTAEAGSSPMRIVASPGVRQRWEANPRTSAATDSRTLAARVRPSRTTVSEDDGAVAMPDDAVLAVPLHGASEDGPLDLGADAGELLGAVGVGDAGDVLFDDRAGVQFGGHVVRGCTDELDAALLGLLVGARPGERGQERVMDVDDRHADAIEELRREDLHVACEHDQVAAALEQLEQLFLGF